MTVTTEVVPGRGHAAVTRAKTKSGPVTEVAVAVRTGGERGTGLAEARSGPRGHGQDLRRSPKRSVVDFFVPLFISSQKIHTHIFSYIKYVNTLFIYYSFVNL